jgi:hypothetical protein
MLGNQEAERQIIETTYEDTATVYRHQTITVGNIDKTKELLIYKDIICALSQKQLNNTNQTIANNEIDYSSKLFVSPDIDILAGDKIDVMRCGYVYKFESAGEPFRYATHQEILLRKRENA